MRTLPLPGLAVIGGGPAGLMAAETARAAGREVDVYEAKGSVGRKFLVAGKGGLNLTHSDPPDVFATRFRERAAPVAGWLRDFDAAALREWARGLGIDTFVGTSGRVFPMDLKAAPLLRGWVRRLRDQGVRFHVQHRWRGFGDDGALVFDAPEGELAVTAAATVLALGGASWPQLGSDGAWTGALRDAGADVARLRPANCGFDVGWSAHFSARFAGAPVKPVRLAIAPRDGAAPRWRQGECVVSATGLEGSAIYALSAELRDRIDADGHADLLVDLAPGRDAASSRCRRAAQRVRTPASENRARRRAGRTPARMRAGRGLRRSGGARRRDQGDPGHAAAATPGRRSDQYRRRRDARIAGRPADAGVATGRVLRRRDARLGSADRGIPAHRMLRQRGAGRPRCGRLAGRVLALSGPVRARRR